MEEQEVKKPDLHFPEVLAIVLAVVAVLVSGYSLIAGQRQHEDERIAELLDQLYEGYAENTVVENWEVSHLDEVPETYEQVRDVLRAYATQLPHREQTRIYFVERGIAIRLLTGFEHLFKRWRAVSAEDSPGRKALLDEEIEYYTNVYLRNPRLLWWWSDEGGGLVHTMDPPTIEFYDQRVLHNPDKPLTQRPDPVGILPGFIKD